MKTSTPPNGPKRYFLKRGDAAWEEVTKAQFVSAERGAGFHNTLGQPDEPATGGFGNGGLGGGALRGRIVDMAYAKPKQYDWDPEFRDLFWPKRR